MLVALFAIAGLAASANVQINMDFNCTTFNPAGVSATPSPGFVLTTAATACSDKYTPAACSAIFGADIANADLRPEACSMVGTGTDAVFNEDIKQLAVSSCPKHCGYCCETPEYKCENKPFPRTNCATVKPVQCTDPKWRQILAEDCPNVCGFCLTGGCIDAAIECANDKSICRNVDMQSFVKVNCQRTCGYCSTTSPGSGVTAAPTCVPAVADKNPSCANWVKNGFCNNTFYTKAQRLADCGRSCAFLC
ncbi:unnamed protein product [Cylicocyclus nassatus]|uniref:ShKT domain-containing protein n=1 Tax=Cylicocyclus nassatus TaxID=53992 RepID=A0AA36H3R4_CYLNA|nr:unnamed protein product [Cylicocyclus nassatus]